MSVTSILTVKLVDDDDHASITIEPLLGEERHDGMPMFAFDPGSTTPVNVSLEDVVRLSDALRELAQRYGKVQEPPL